MGTFLHQKCQGTVIPDTLDSSFVRVSLSGCRASAAAPRARHRRVGTCSRCRMPPRAADDAPAWSETMTDRTSGASEGRNETRRVGSLRAQYAEYLAAVVREELGFRPI